MATITVDLPAFSVDYPPASVFGSDVLSTTDTSAESEIILTTNAQPIGVSYFAESAVTGWDGETLVFMPDDPAGYTLTSATYVTIAYRESADTDPAAEYSGYSPAPSSWPFVSLDSSGTGGFYTIDGLPIGSYGGELVWPGHEFLPWLTGDPGDQFPANRMWLEPGSSFSPFVNVHVAYYAIRLTYDNGEPPPPVSVVPPLRQWPRSDALGASSTRRVYPPPPTIQASNRRGPAAIL